MTCHRIPGGFVCGPDTYRLRLTDGRYVFMEWHSYFGPSFFYDRGGVQEILSWWKDPRLIEALTWFERRGRRA